MIAGTKQADSNTEFRQILGIKFFVGEPQRAIDLLRNGGLLVVPAASSLKNIPKDKGYRT